MSKNTRPERKHTSYSEISCFSEDMAAWYIKYGLGIKGGISAKLERGKAVENAISYALSAKKDMLVVEHAVQMAIDEFRYATALGCDEAQRQKELDNIEGYVRIGYEALSQFGKPTSMQNELLLTDIDIDKPILGYDDYQFIIDDKPVSIDLKTTLACPSKMRDSHRIQAAIYSTALPEHDIKFCYVTPKKFAIYDFCKDEAKQIMDDFVVRFKAMKYLLSLTENIEDLAGIFAPSYSSFYWDDPILRGEAKRIFGL
tara:strand:- start:163 stop:933 length:771 start_codon:yes stop_codon:yes gene_type:complete